MTREECENRLLEMARLTYGVYREYMGEGAQDLSITILDSGTIGISDRDHQIDVLGNLDAMMGRTGYWRGVLGLDRIVDA